MNIANMHESAEESNSGKKARLSTLAMLVDCLMKYEGLESTKELADRTLRDASQIRKAKREVACARANVRGQIAPHPGKCDRLPGQIAPPTRSNMTDFELAQDLQSRAPKELPIGNSYTSKVTPLYPPTVENQVRLEKGVLIVSDDFRDFWTKQLGDPENLNLALIQAAGYVQENSRRPLEAQVSAQLARYARDKRERDKRYESAKSKSVEPDRSAEWAQAFAELEGVVQ